MRHTSLLLVGLLLLGAAVSGCLGGDGDTDTPTGADGAPDPTPTADTGSVSGQILNLVLDPIADAAVALTSGGTIVQDTRSDSLGRFTFNSVEPGQYRVQASSICCKAGLKAVNVEAGKTAEVSFTLEPFTAADLEAPFVKEWEWHGFISCGVGVVGAGLAACSIAEDTPVEDPNEDFFENFSVSKGLKTLSVGMTWQPVGGVSGGEFALLIEENVCEEVACADAYLFDEMEGPPALVTNINNDDITDAAFKWDNITDTFGIQFRIFASGDATLVYQQPFSIYVKEFYYEEAPEAFSPIPDQ